MFSMKARRRCSPANPGKSLLGGFPIGRPCPARRGASAHRLSAPSPVLGGPSRKRRDHRQHLQAPLSPVCPECTAIVRSRTELGGERSPTALSSLTSASGNRRRWPGRYGGAWPTRAPGDDLATFLPAAISRQSSVNAQLAAHDLGPFYFAPRG